MSFISSPGKFITESFDYDQGREVTVYIPSAPAELIIFCGDGQQISKWGKSLETPDPPPTMIIGMHGLKDEQLRLEEYSPGFNPKRFSAHENFVVAQIYEWIMSRFGISKTPQRTAFYGASAGGELALALGLRHPELFDAILCASPGAGFKPPAKLPLKIPRTYLVAGKQEPFFLENAKKWAEALIEAGAEVVMKERDGAHGGKFWEEEFLLMIKWASQQERR